MDLDDSRSAIRRRRGHPRLLREAPNSRRLRVFGVLRHAQCSHHSAEIPERKREELGRRWDRPAPASSAAKPAEPLCTRDVGGKSPLGIIPSIADRLPLRKTPSSVRAISAQTWRSCYLPAAHFDRRWMFRELVRDVRNPSSCTLRGGPVGNRSKPGDRLDEANQVGRDCHDTSWPRRAAFQTRRRRPARIADFGDCQGKFHGALNQSAGRSAAATSSRQALPPHAVESFVPRGHLLRIERDLVDNVRRNELVCTSW